MLNISKNNIKDHYELEKKLASKLMNSTKEERGKLYNEVYDEIYTKVPYLLPMQIEVSKEKMNNDLRFVKHFINKNTKYLELGPGNCLFAFAICKIAESVTAVDVSEKVTENKNVPQNFHLVISDGTSIPVPPNSIDIAYSNQLMEHLHPDDAIEQLKNIYQALSKNGLYICRTPNRLSGPHDISKYFDEVATGFHLKEYTGIELMNIMKKVGFKKFKFLFSFKGFTITIPQWKMALIENIISKLPKNIKHKIASFRPIRMTLGINIIAKK